MDDEQLLLKRLRQGDKEALESVSKLHHAFLVAMATPLGIHELADDVAQQTKNYWWGHKWGQRQ